MKTFFGTDGVRGKANISPMDSETVLRLGRAAAYVFRRNQGRHKILIGKDTRLSGYMLEMALASGITSMGVDVILIGPLPTPGVAFMTKSMRADAGVMISASHNSYEDNGIKFFGCDGFKLADENEREIEQLMNPGCLDKLRADPSLIGKAWRIDDALGRYVVFLKSCIDRVHDFEGLKIVLDCGNGAAYKVVPLVYEELGAEIICTGTFPNGTNINENRGSMFSDHMCQLVKQHGADVGFSYDGDADRVLVSDEKGTLLDGDEIMAILAQDFYERGMLKGDAVVGTVMSNCGLEVFLNAMSLNLHRADVGDRYVLSDMKRLKCNLGGEQSGHVISLDYNTTGDGVLTSLLLLAAVRNKGVPVSQMIPGFVRFPQQLKNIKVKEKRPFSELIGYEKAMRDAEQKLKNRGRVLVRYSGTESKARIMVESDNSQLCGQIIANLEEVFSGILE